MRVVDTLGQIAGRVELALAGAEPSFRAALDALAAQDPWRARAEAQQVLARVPGSPLALAVLADASEAAGLVEEALRLFEDLSRRLPFRASVWLGLARMREAAGAPAELSEQAYARALALARPGEEERRAALFGLTDRALAAGDPARAQIWLDRLVADTSLEANVRRAELDLLLHRYASARDRLATLDIPASDARAAYALGRAWLGLGDARAAAWLLRAVVLGDARGNAALLELISTIKLEGTQRARIRDVIAALGDGESPRWRAAFAIAEGREDEAKRALSDATRAGDIGAAALLYQLGVRDHDAAAVAIACAALETRGDATTPPFGEAARLARFDASAADALDLLASIESAELRPWAADKGVEVLAAWIPDRGEASWSRVLGRLDGHARALHDLDTLSALASLAQKRARPVQLAIVGEFNAGKSTFINALIGQDIAPTGILPTTATLHHLRYAQDAVARIEFGDAEEPRERLVPVAELRRVLGEVSGRALGRVEIRLPLPFLTRIEVLDTPGFNAPDQAHNDAARRALEEADAVIWLLDAGQPFKRTELAFLEPVRDARIPLCVLLNKADRLEATARASVLSHVASELAHAKISPWTEPRALSAKLALQGRLGNASALAQSGWDEVHALVEEELVARSDELKERGLRRRAATLAQTLGASAQERLAKEQDRAQHVAVTWEAARARAASLQSEPPVSAAVEELRPAFQAYARDVALVSTQGADRGALTRYRRQAAEEHLMEPMRAWMQRTAGDTVTIAPEVAQVLARTFGTFGSDDDASLLAFMELALESIVRRLHDVPRDMASLARVRAQREELAWIGRALER